MTTSSFRVTWLRIAAAALALTVSIASVSAQETVKVGLILPLTGPFAPTGRQIEGGVRLYMQQHGDKRRRQEDRADRA